uniref:Cyclin N-terminal domain-containing protein n=1 Tax=Zea mays TaxID=4577 RepID=A0A804MCF9_MAIZE
MAGDEEDHLADAPRVVGVLSALLERVVERNDAVADELAAGTESAAPPSAFRATARPDISVRSYMARIARFAGCSPACYVVAYVYLDRLLRRARSAPAVDSYTVHRLLITAVLAAVKFMDDVIVFAFLLQYSMYYFRIISIKGMCLHFLFHYWNWC